MAVSVVDIQVNATGATQQLRLVQQGALATDRAVSRLIGTVSKLAIALGAMQVIKFVFAKTAELESQTRSLEVLTGSAAKAKQIISELQQLGAVTPFTSTELIDAAKRLQAFGVEGDKVVKTTKRLADVSGATGAALQGLVTAYGQVQAKGRLQGEELLQFQERGIDLQGELQRMYGLSGEDLRKALEKGLIGSEAVEVAIIRLTNAGGKYANGAIAQSDTLNGKFSTLIDNIEMLAKKIGKLLEPAFKGILNIVTGIVNKISEVLDDPELKAYLELANKIMGQKNNAEAGADKKTVNNQLFNTRAEISKLKKEIDAAQKAGISPTTRSAPVLGVDGQVVAGGGTVLPEMQAELKQLEQQAIKLDNRLKELRNQSKAKPVATTPKTPALLKGKPKPAKPMPMDSLLNQNINNALQLELARQETLKQKDLSGAQGTENEAQAKRMIEYAHEYRKALFETKALTTQMVIIDKQRSAIIASYPKDKQGEVALGFDQRKADLLNQIKLTTERTNKTAEEHYGKALEAQRADELTLKKKLEDETLLGQQRKQSLTDELDLAQARLRGNEAEVILKQQLRNIMLGTSGLDEQEVTNTLKKIDALKQQLTAAQELKALYSDIGTTIKSSVIEGIQGTIDGTKRLQDVATDLLNKIADKLLDVATNLALFGSISGTGSGGGLLGSFFGGGKSPAAAVGGSIVGGNAFSGAASSSIFSAGTGTAFGGMSIAGFAAGGRPPVGKASLVGEKGPELFVPSAAGTIIPAGSFGGGTNVVVNVDATGSNVQGDDQSSKQLGTLLAAAVQKELIKQKRPGGILA